MRVSCVGFTSPLPDGLAIVTPHAGHHVTLIEAAAAGGLGRGFPFTVSGARLACFTAQPYLLHIGGLTGTQHRVLARPRHQILRVVQVLVQAAVIFNAEQQNRSPSLKAPVAMVATLIPVLVGLVAVVPGGAAEILVPALEKAV